MFILVTPPPMRYRNRGDSTPRKIHENTNSPPALSRCRRPLSRARRGIAHVQTHPAERSVLVRRRQLWRPEQRRQKRFDLGALVVGGAGLQEAPRVLSRQSHLPAQARPADQRGGARL